MLARSGELLMWRFVWVVLAVTIVFGCGCALGIVVRYQAADKDRSRQAEWQIHAYGDGH